MKDKWLQIVGTCRPPSQFSIRDYRKDSIKTTKGFLLFEVIDHRFDKYQD